MIFKNHLILKLLVSHIIKIEIKIIIYKYILILYTYNLYTLSVIDNILIAKTELYKILSKGISIISIDCEAINEMSRFGKLSLVQIAISSNEALIFDMMKIGYIQELEIILMKDNIIKIFHDSNEDCSLLINSGISSKINGIFDTQVANRISSEYTYNNKISKDSSISLKDLLENKLKITKDDKNEIRDQMKDNKYFWAYRPLNNKMLKYAAEDVLHLINIYYYFLSSLKSDLLLKIMSESKASLSYSLLNLDIEVNTRYLLHQNHKEISGMLK